MCCAVSCCVESCPVLYGLALPCLAFLSLALSCLALPCLASSGLALLCFGWPGLVLCARANVRYTFFQGEARSNNTWLSATGTPTLDASIYMCKTRRKIGLRRPASLQSCTLGWPGLIQPLAKHVGKLIGPSTAGELAKLHSGPIAGNYVSGWG